MTSAAPADAAAAKARTLLGMHRADKAMSTLAVALAAEPNSAELLRLMAQAQLMAEQPQEAWTTASRAIAADPNEEWGHRLISVAYADLGNHVGAIRAAENATRLAPHYWMVWHRHAIACAQAGHHPEAKASATRAVQLAPDQPESHFALGFASMRSGDTAMAEAAYRRVLAMDPTHSAALNNLGLVNLRQRGRLRQATQGFGAALAVDAQLDVARRNLSVVARRYMRRFHFAVVIAYFVLAATFGKHNYLDTDNQVSSASRLHAGLVGGGALIVLLGAIVVVHQRLPANLRPYYRRLPRNDKLFGAWLAVDVTALVLICALAVPTTYSGRSALSEIAWVLILAGLLLSWLPRFIQRKGPRR